MWPWSSTRNTWLWSCRTKEAHGHGRGVKTKTPDFCHVVQKKTCGLGLVHITQETRGFGRGVKQKHVAIAYWHVQ